MSDAERQITEDVNEDAGEGDLDALIDAVEELTSPDVSEALGAGQATVDEMIRQSVDEGVDAVLRDLPRETEKESPRASRAVPKYTDREMSQMLARLGIDTTLTKCDVQLSQRDLDAIAGLDPGTVVIDEVTDVDAIEDPARHVDALLDHVFAKAAAKREETTADTPADQFPVDNESSPEDAMDDVTSAEPVDAGAATPPTDDIDHATPEPATEQTAELVPEPVDETAIATAGAHPEAHHRASTDAPVTATPSSDHDDDHPLAAEDRSLADNVETMLAGDFESVDQVLDALFEPGSAAIRGTIDVSDDDLTAAGEDVSRLADVELGELSTFDPPDALSDEVPTDPPMPSSTVDDTADAEPATSEASGAVEDDGENGANHAEPSDEATPQSTTGEHDDSVADAGASSEATAAPAPSSTDDRRTTRDDDDENDPPTQHRGQLIDLKPFVDAVVAAAGPAVYRGLNLVSYPMHFVPQTQQRTISFIALTMLLWVPIVWLMVLFMG